MNLAFVLHDVARAFRVRFDERARGLGVTRQQWRALLNLAHRPGATQAELADALEVERITLCRMVDRLTEAGLVERRGDPADRRVWRLHNTAKAEEIVGRLATIGRELEADALRDLEPPEERALTATLLRVRQTLASLEAPRAAVVA